MPTRSSKDIPAWQTESYPPMLWWRGTSISNFGEITWLELGDENTIREFATLHRGTEGGGGITRVGSRNLCMAYTHVAHDCQVGDNIVLSNGATLGGHVKVDDFAIIGGLSARPPVQPYRHPRLCGGNDGGRAGFAFMDAGCGQPCPCTWSQSVGLRRVGASRETIAALKKAFRLVWRSELSRAAALAQLSEEYASIPELMEFVDFVRNSERGLCPAEKNIAKGLDDDAPTS